jgi:hypothetical protein
VSESETFGARYRALNTSSDRLVLERAEDRRASFAAVDEALDGLALAALRGQRVIDVTPPPRKRQPDRVALLLHSDALAAAIADHFSAAHHQARGAWYLPDKAHLSVGVIHIAHWMRENERFALSLSDAEYGRTTLAQPDAVAICGVPPV